ncbi:hypothetical protein CXU03_04250 [Akkermansia muciniphila]|nr:hypothetical protein CXU03_04250 [Akkermansia muciniphila]
MIINLLIICKMLNKHLGALLPIILKTYQTIELKNREYQAKYHSEQELLILNYSAHKQDALVT